MNIFVVSRSRFELQQHPTLESLVRLNPVLVVPENQVSDYTPVKDYFQCDVVGCPADGIGPTRQWILENNNEPFCMVDDDMKFFVHDTDPYYLREANYDDIYLNFEKIFDRPEIHATMGMRTSNREWHKKVLKEQYWFKPTRANNIHFIRPVECRELGARFDLLPVMEDFAFTLHLLTRGYPNVAPTFMFWNQRGSGKEGGCSDYRTLEVHNESAKALVAAYPGFVHLREVENNTAGAWSGLETRLDVSIDWRKIYLNAKEHHDVDRES